jgi:hypothetical protein
MRGVRLGYFGASTGGAAALVAAVERPQAIRAIVCRGSRTDMAAGVLAEVIAPALFIVGEADSQVLRWNRESFAELRGEKRLEIIPGATHLFEEPGKLEEVVGWRRLVSQASEALSVVAEVGKERGSRTENLAQLYVSRNARVRSHGRKRSARWPMAEPIRRAVATFPGGSCQGLGDGDYLQNASRLGLLLPRMELMDLCGDQMCRVHDHFTSRPSSDTMRFSSVFISAILALTGVLRAGSAAEEAQFISNARQLIYEGKRSGEGYFSNDGKMLIFQSEREEGNPFYQIYLLISKRAISSSLFRRGKTTLRLSSTRWQGSQPRRRILTRKQRKSSGATRAVPLARSAATVG